MNRRELLRKAYSASLEHMGDHPDTNLLSNLEKQKQRSWPSGKAAANKSGG